MKSQSMKFIFLSMKKIEFLNINVPLKNTVSKAVELISNIYKIDIKHTIIIDKKIPKI